jgi:hypothetical protein
MGDDGIVMLGLRMYVPDNQALKQNLLREAHESKFTVHPGSTKMYHEAALLVAKYEKRSGWLHGKV